MPTVLSGRDLAMTYDRHPLFEGLTVAIDAGSRVGLIGPNGSGKSTLLRILAGEVIPDAGERVLAQGLRIAYLPQQDRFTEDETPETALLRSLAASHPGLEEHEREVQARVLLDQSGFGHAGNPTIHQPVATLSGGWRKRVAILRALVQEPDVLLMDEPTNHLDLEGIWWLEGVLADWRSTYVVISHDRFFLERVCGRIIEINKVYPGGSFSAQGGYSAFLERRAEFIANQQRQQASLDNRVRQEIEWMRRNPAAQTKKSKARLDNAGQLIQDLAALTYRTSQNQRVDLAFTGTGRQANELVTLSGVAGGRGERTLFRDVDLILGPTSRLGVLGLNGSGKSTFLQVLAGTLPPTAGSVRHHQRLRVVVFDQRRERLNPAQPLRRALCPDGQTVVVHGRGLAVAGWAKRFLFTPAQLDLPVGQLSGGEQARVLLADLMRQEADLLILDEPTNDLDIPSLEVLEAGLKEFTGAVVLVTHDRYLLDRVCTQLIALDGSGNAYRVADCAQWEALAERLQQAQDAAAPAAAATRPSAAAPGAITAVNAPRTALNPKERRELERMAAAIEKAEAALAAATARTNDPAVAMDAAALHEACTAMATAQAAVDRLYARWQELEAKAKASSR